MAKTGDNSKAALVAALNGALADSLALYIKTKNFHWHVAGPRFRDLHLLFDDQATQILGVTDLIGERVAMTASVKDGSVDESIYRISLDRKINPHPEYVYATYFWHMDGISNSDVPPYATFLTCRKRAPKGGQTEFASTYAAYEGLAEEDKTDLDGVRIVHSVRSGIVRAFGSQAPAEDPRAAGMVLRRDHPAVWTHATGRKSLVIGSKAESVVGLPMPEGRALIERLTEWAVQPDFTYRHDWREGDFVVWDNTGAMHRVVPYAEESGRLMHRTSIAGVERVS